MGAPVNFYRSFLVISSLVTYAKSQCQPQPVVAPIQDVRLSNGASTRGIFMTVGSENQNISFLVRSDFNETYVYGSDGFCDKALYPGAACVTYRGGAYDISKSSTDRSIDSPLNSDEKLATWTEDTLSITKDRSLSSFGFGISQQDLGEAYISQASLGLGRNSSLLRVLNSTGVIGTKVYSMFWGLVGGSAARQTDGSLVIGGLDKSLIADPNNNFTASLSHENGCGSGLSVTISDIVLNWPNGTDTSLFGESRSAAIQACIDPAFAGLIAIPRGYYVNFVELAGGKSPRDRTGEARSIGINYWTMLFDPDGVYYGDFSIKLRNSISIRIPNTELVVPDKYIASDGTIRTNNSVRNVVINSLQNVTGNNPAIIGRLFLSSAYLMINQDAGNFHVWQADTRSKEPEILAVDRDNKVISNFCAPSSTPSSVARRKGSKLSGGAIGGIVVGAVGGVAILGTIGFLMYRRRVKGKATTAGTAQEQEIQSADMKPPTYSMVQAAPQELSTEQFQVIELDSRAVDRSD